MSPMNDLKQATGQFSAEDKRALLAELLAKKASQPRCYPLSFAQQRMWVLWQLDPRSPAYNVATAIRSRDTLDAAVMEQCLNEVVRRHASLRTTFTVKDGRPVQLIASHQSLRLPTFDLSCLPSEEREREISRLSRQEAMQPFDLTAGPLFQAKLLWLGQDGVVLLLTMHHIVADGWSIDILIREIRLLYAAFTAGQPSPLPPLPIQYVDYALWQQQQFQEQALAAEAAFWQQQLAGAPDLLELPTPARPGPRPPVQSLNGANYPFTLPATLRPSVKRFSQQEGATLFMTLLTAFKVLLYRYSQQRDILVGTPIANRQRLETEGLIGFFANTLVLRTQINGRPSFRQLLGQVRQTALAAYGHQQLPFEQLLEQVKPNRDTSYSPLFQHFFTFQESLLAVHGISDQAIQVDNGTARFDLSLSLIDNGETISGDCQYNTDLFDPATIARMMGHFQQLLSAALDDPDAPVVSLPLLTPAEQQQLLVNWNETAVPYPADTPIHQLFEQQVLRTPQAIAIQCGPESLTYEELNRQANQLARTLCQEIGIGPETLAAVCLERSSDMVIAVLAILKAGGAYIPLDPTYPPERLAFMIQDCRPHTIITRAEFTGLLPTSDAQRFFLEQEEPAIRRQDEANLTVEVTAGNLAYVLYTSGSTGRPKGVMVSHQGIGNLAMAQREAFAVAPDSRVFQFASLSFDASVSELFVTLLAGATLILPTAETLLPGPELVERLQKQAVTIMTCPPSIWAILPPEKLPHLHTVVSAGEACPPSLLARWAAGRRFVNAYGPTEATVCAALDLYRPEEDTPTIGRPIANVQLYLLDANMQPVPVGLPGEIYIATVGLARGYWQRPGLTAERFLPNPFSQQPGSRLYKTGDLARYRPDGRLDFLGRVDYQVKIRGFRIETGEVEAALRAHPAVREVVVVAREQAGTGKQLVAFVVPVAGSTPPTAELRAFLQRQLPDYMIPHHITYLDTLPLGPNGKVDRAALPSGGATRSELIGPYAGPRTPAEEVLTAAWLAVLNQEQVSIHDNFFELGGDSILAIQLATRVSESGLSLTPRQIFHHPTIARQAQIAGAATSSQTEQGIMTGDVPLTPIQHWFLAEEQPQPHHFVQSVKLAVRQPLDLAYLSQTFRHLLNHHDSLRLRFTRHDSSWRQWYARPDETFTVTEADLSTLSPAEQDNQLVHLISQAHAALNLAEGPLVHAIYFRLGPGRPDQLLIVIHHLVVDAVSWRVLLEDLHSTYKQLKAGAAVTLPAKTTPFKDWSERLTAYAQSAALRKELPYWLELSRLPAVFLPLDFPASPEANVEGSAATITRSLPPVATQSLLQDGLKAYRLQVNEMLLAALALAFRRWSGPSDLLIDLEGHGREELFAEVDLLRTVGWFTTLFPICIHLGSAEEPGSILVTVKEQLRRLPQHGIGYGLLRYLSQDETIRQQLNSLPRPSVSFNYLGQQSSQAAALDAFFDMPAESGGPLQSPANRRSHLLAVTGYIQDGQLITRWNYSQALHRPATMAALADHFMDALQLLLAHCLQPDAGRYTPADFPLARLDERRLAKLSQLLERTGRQKALPG